MSSIKQVVITGAGVVSPIAATPGAFWRALVERRSGIGPITRFDAERFSSSLAGEVDEAELAPGDEPLAFEISRMALFVRCALRAGRDALLEAARLDGEGRALPGGRVVMGVAMGGLPEIEAGVMVQETRGPRRTTPFLIPSLIPNMAASMIALRHHMGDVQQTIAGACASGSQAIGEAVRAIRDGDCDWVLAGGAEAVTTPITYSGFEAMRALSLADDASRAPRPFDAERDGMIVGEGAAAFVLEEEGRARARGAPILGRVVGYAACSGATDLSAISVEEAARSMRGALDDAGLEADDIDGVFAQASGMVSGDAAELAAVKAVFAECRRPPVVTSIKGHTGYLFAANGPMNVLAAVQAMAAATMPATLKLTRTDPPFADLDIPTAARPVALRHCLINAFGFGGINTSLIVAR